jgi:cellulose synthase/poly-beta-1,6-N-acetylglucosamine synthase-like glycosyltransferase
MEFVFWISAFMIAYPYAGYPLLLALLRPVLGRSVRRGPGEPPLSFVISAYNEAANMQRKLENTLAIDYPRERLQILVVSDASTDATDAIAASFAARGVELERLPVRSGKAACQNTALSRVTGEILVFSDARILVAPGSLRAMAANFADPTVGCVSSRDEIVNEKGEPDPGAGEGFYVRYEMALRSAEAEIGSLVGASGSFYAVRRALAGPSPLGLERDFLTPLRVAAAGFRTVHEPEAVGAYGTLAAPEAEFRRKVRTVMRGMSVLFHMRMLLDPFRFPRFAWQLWSHKILRWTVPFFLITLFVSSAVLAARGGLYTLAFGAQAAIYALALVAMANRRLETLLVFRLPLFFANVNLSILVAWIRYLSGSRQVTWEPSRR